MIQISAFVILITKKVTSDIDENGSLPLYFVICESSANLFGKGQWKIEVFIACHN